MNNAIIPTPTTLPASTGKVFKGFNVDAFVAGILPHADDERAVPSLIKMNSASAIAALGGKTTAPAFITGLLYMLCAHSFGQKRAADMAAKLPAYAAHCLNAGAALLPAGKGANVAQVKGAVSIAIQAMLTLPAKKITVERVKSARTIEAPANEAPASYMLTDVMLMNPPMDTDNQRYGAFYLRQSQKMTEDRNNDPAYRADCLKIEQSEWRAEQAEIRAMDVMADRAIAILEFRKLAEFLHVKLSATQIKALAA
jgi:hypothetical protein